MDCGLGGVGNGMYKQQEEETYQTRGKCKTHVCDALMLAALIQECPLNRSTARQELNYK